MRTFALLASVAVVGCAKTQDVGSPPDMVHVIRHDLRMADLRPAAADLTPPSDDLTPPATDDSGPVATDDAGVDLVVAPTDDAGVTDDTGTPPTDDASVDMAMTLPDLVMPPPPRDMTGVSPPDLTGVTPPDLAGVTRPDLAGVTCNLVVINELQTGASGDASNEFVELYNTCPNALNLVGWKLVYRSGLNMNPGNVTTGDTTLHAFGVGEMIAAHDYLVFAGATFFGQSDGLLSSGLKDHLGAVGIRDPAKNLIDSVGYGTVDPLNGFIETAAAPDPPVVPFPGNSISRVPNGIDRDDNSKDFRVSTMATPHMANQ